MKTSTTLSLILIAGLMQACGGYHKDPVEGLQDLKANAQRENDTRNLDAPVTVPEYREKIVYKEVPVEVAVPKYQKVVQLSEQATLSGDTFVISTEEAMDFTEGKASVYKIRARSMMPDVKVALKAENLPAGAKIQKDASEPDLYTLTWTPAFNTVAPNSGRKIEKLKLGLDIASAPDEATRKKAAGITKQKEISLVVWTDQTPPSDLKIEGLGTQVNEGTLTPFSVTVKVPGLDGSSVQKPTLDVTYDGLNYTPGNKFNEQNGARYVRDTSKVKYLGDSKWQFDLAFDTKNVAVEKQLAVDGTPIANADGLRVRLSFKVRSPLGTATPVQLSLLKINYQASSIASRPVFDLQSLGGSSLKVAPGDTLSAVLLVSSGNVHQQVKVEVPNLTGISGAPKISCKDSTLGNYLQVCTFNWSVPCTAKAGDLNQKITLTAQTVSGDQKSDPVKQEITLTPSSAQNSKCAIVQTMKKKTGK